MQPEYNSASIEHMLTVGRGGAIIYLLGTDTSPYRDMILDHCIHNKAYDTQLEYSRACYLYPLIRNSPDRDFYRDAILEALRDADDESSVSQLFDFAVLFAHDGDETARSAIHEKFDKHNLKEINSIATSLIEIDGIEGLLHVLDYMGSDSNVLERNDYAIYIHQAEKSFGVEETRQALTKAYEQNPNIRTYLDRISNLYTPSLILENVIKSHKDDNLHTHLQEAVKGITWRELKRNPESDKLARLWSKFASDDEIVKAANDIIYEKDPQKLALYLRIFHRHEFPLHPSFLIDLTESLSLRVSHAALLALAGVKHPDVRTLFERLVQAPEWSVSAVRLLRSNYRDGDHLIIEKLLNDAADIHQMHDLECALIDVYKNNLGENAMRSLLFAYENGPCSNCRYEIVKLMHELGHLPEWIVQECVFDTRESIRKMAQELISINQDKLK